MAKEENLFEEKAKEEGGKPAANTDKLKALRAAMDKIEKNYGKGTIIKQDEQNNNQKTQKKHIGISLGVTVSLAQYIQ